MIEKIILFDQTDKDTKRRQVLAKVYSLLIRLAEESENRPILPILVGEEAMVEVPILSETDASTKEVNS